MIAILTLCLAICNTATEAAENWELRLQTAQQHYDLKLAESLAEEIRKVSNSALTAESRLVFAKCLLFMAEMNRVEFERYSVEMASKRRPLGKAIDEAAETALAQLEYLDDSAEVWRLRADCYGVMIRNDFLAKKFRKRMDNALAKALEQDPGNPYVQLSVARPYLFADVRHGGNLDKAVEILNDVLEKYPDFEAALLLRGLAYQRKNNRDAANHDWQRAIAINPYCRLMTRE